MTLHPAQSEEALDLEFLGTTSAGGNCPNAYRTNRGTYVVQGYRVTDEQALRQLHERGMPDTETAVEIPAGLLKFFPREA
ncbi:hypothetical protein [Amycolatopsis echigonensis]|uniref:Uncharacterized protein n=1 Tax=Amycolatopsis echigonensis TaxID=2576905 RepID=A0A2N3WDE2_9PSEU|nr:MULTISPECIES: hypothetical protein [Amycolatopsis]MBB2501305.1 hypothetical protein [Amycolatopsis echigonensis]PKV91916.1 hypothetical protein ATK30_2704 [Amycolatopsis niigatensis]